ncbi:MAG TPA: MFS transporter [Xanthobacteraceae bacterium]|nr:MFS transporter [Xanthobacteraceae bacterium]
MTRSAVVVLVATLVAVYIVSQFLRNSIAVIAPNLAAELQMSAAEIGLLASSFFFTFALAQIPLGLALDRWGARRCILACMAVTVAGAVLFALATGPAMLVVARTLLGLGSASSLMAPLALYAARFPPRRFATLVGIQIGFGSLGTLLATVPLAWSTVVIGWRGSFMVLAGLSAFMLAAVFLVVRDPPRRAEHRVESFPEALRGLWSIIRTPVALPVFLMHLTSYSSIGLIVGLWGGPYLTHVYGYDLVARGEILLLPAVGTIAGSLFWGWTADNVFGSRKIPVLIGAIASASCLGTLALAGSLPVPLLWTLFAVFGMACAFTTVLIAHGQSLFPQHLSGRVITLFNMGTMGGVFLSQTISGFVIDQFPRDGDVYPVAAYQAVFGMQALALLAACWAYNRRVPDRRVSSL